MGLPSSLAYLHVTVQFILNSFRASAAHVHKSTGGFLDGSQSLWALWATPSSELHRETDRLLRLQLGRFAGSAFAPPALRDAWGGTRAPARPVVDARPVGSRAESASTG